MCNMPLSDQCGTYFPLPVVNGMLNGQYIKEILLSVQDLKPEQRKTVLDYILWQRSGGK